MRDINAVMTSAFVLGRANIEAARGHDVAKYQADLRLKAFSDDALKLIDLKLRYQLAVAQTLTEQQRIAIVAQTEEEQANTEYAMKDALWDIELYQYGANLLAGIGGGTSVAGASKLSKTQSTIGGALSGAAAGMALGAMQGAPFGPGVGTAAGAVIGGLAGYLSA
jgi:hypothetical protein